MFSSQRFIEHPRFLPWCLPSGHQTWPWKIACKYQLLEVFLGEMVYKWVIFHITVLFPDSIRSILQRDPLDRWTHRRQLPFPALLRLENVACRESLLRRNLMRCLICLFMYIYIYIMYKCMCVCVCDTFIFLQYAYILSRTCALEKCVFVWGATCYPLGSAHIFLRYPACARVHVCIHIE